MPCQTREGKATLDVPDLRADKRHKESMLTLARKQVEQAERAGAVAKQEIKEARQQEAFLMILDSVMRR